MKDLKNTLTSIIGLLIAICVSLLGVSGEVTLPEWLTVSCVIVIAVGTAFVGWATGRNADLTKKCDAQLWNQAKAKDQK